MKALKRYVRRASGILQLHKYREELKRGCHFVSGPDPLVRAFQAKNRQVAVLPSDFAPGFDISGRFEPEKDGFGNITFQHPSGPAVRSDLAISGLGISLFPKVKMSADALWSEELEPSQLCQKIILACLQHSHLSPEVYQFALRWILQTDDEQVKRAPLFALLNDTMPGVCLTISELKRAKAVHLVGPTEMLNPMGSGAMWLEDAPCLRRVLTRLGIPFQAKDESVKAGMEILDGSKSECPYLEPAWGQAERSGELVSIPVYGQAFVVIDMEKFKLRTPMMGAEGLVQFPIDERLQTTLDHEEKRGDTKVHEIHLLTISDGQHRVALRARFKDYYEGGPVQAELDVYQDRARKILFGLARVLEDPSQMTEFRKLF